MLEAQPLLSVRGLSKRFGAFQAVQDVTFDVEQGEIVGLVGPNGAGKTTLFNCVTGNLRCDAGTVEFDGRELRGMPSYKRARLGIGRTFQRVEVFPELSVRRHLLIAIRARSGEGSVLKDLCGLNHVTPDELTKADEILELVGVAGEAEIPVAALGLGTCRLVELARALATEPRLLMADEPSSGLDTKETADLAKVLRSVQQDRGMAFLLVEHDLRMVSDVVDRVLVMDLGSLISQGTFDKVMADPPVRRAYLGQSD
jgi:branched-chain amino acid transport system ATP-binding protein